MGNSIAWFVSQKVTALQLPLLHRWIRSYLPSTPPFLQLSLLCLPRYAALHETCKHCQHCPREGEQNSSSQIFPFRTMLGEVVHQWGKDHVDREPLIRQQQQEGSFMKEDWRFKLDLKWSNGRRVCGMAQHTGCGGKVPRWSWLGLLRPTGALTLVVLPTPLFLPKWDSSFTANLPHTLADLCTEQDPTRVWRGRG